MKLFVVALLACCTAAAGLCRPALADLPADINTVLQDKLLRGRPVGIEVVRLGKSPADAQTVYSKDSRTPLIPASNLKLVTAAAFLDRLGPDFQFHTELLTRDGGDLALVGDGDPALGDAEYLKKSKWGVTTTFEMWADNLRRANITAVRDVVVDDGIFDDAFTHPNWPANQLQNRYCAQVGGVNLNANCVDLLVRGNGRGAMVGFSLDPATRYVAVRNTCVGGKNAIVLTRKPGTNQIILDGQAPGASSSPVSVTIHDPPLFAATVLAETLRAKGIAVTGGVRRDRTVRGQRDRWKVVGIHNTPMPTVLNRLNKDSMNVYAESLCKRLGHESSGRREPGSWENGTAAMGAFLKTTLGIPESEYRFDDGCGLSRKNAVSAHVLSRVLVHSYHARGGGDFVNSLAVAGVDGTLEDRFRERDVRHLKGRVLGKSGFINGVRALSGYLKGGDGQWYSFSILMNDVPDGGVKVLQERIVKAIDSHAGPVADVER